MKHKPYLYYTALILLIGALGAAGFYFRRQLIGKYYGQKAPGSSALADSFPKVTREDVKPIVIPNDVHKRGHAVKVPILMYHHVGDFPANSPDRVRVGLTVPPQNFEQQISWLNSQGYNSISLAELLLYAQGQKTLPKKPIVVTFDDGYDDALKNAVPILKKYGFSGSFAIITSFPGWHDGTNIYATWEQIAAAKDAGMEIVCHTQNHFDGKDAKFDAAYIYNNLEGCRDTLKQKLGVDNHILVYPYGHYTPTYLEQAKKAGFVLGLTVHMGTTVNLENLMELPRLRVRGQENLEKFEKNMAM